MGAVRTFSGEARGDLVTLLLKHCGIQ